MYEWYSGIIRNLRWLGGGCNFLVLFRSEVLEAVQEVEWVFWFLRLFLFQILSGNQGVDSRKIFISRKKKVSDILKVGKVFGKLFFLWSDVGCWFFECCVFCFCQQVIFDYRFQGRRVFFFYSVFRDFFWLYKDLLRRYLQGVWVFWWLGVMIVIGFCS